MYADVAELLENHLRFMNRGRYGSNLKTILARCLVVGEHEKIRGLNFVGVSKRNFYKV